MLPHSLKNIYIYTDIKIKTVLFRVFSKFFLLKMYLLCVGWLDEFKNSLFFLITCDIF